MTIGFSYDDGGRAAAGFVGDTGDCVTRAIAIATGEPYRDVYDDLYALLKAAPERVRGRSTSPRDGVPRNLYEPYLFDRGFMWEPTMRIGSGCQVHLRRDELPSGTLIVRVSRHLCAVVNGVVRDTHDPSRDGTRCVYGHYGKALA